MDRPPLEPWSRRRPAAREDQVRHLGRDPEACAAPARPPPPPSKPAVADGLHGTRPATAPSTQPRRVRRPEPEGCAPSAVSCAKRVMPAAASRPAGRDGMGRTVSPLIARSRRPPGQPELSSTTNQSSMGHGHNRIIPPHQFISSSISSKCRFQRTRVARARCEGARLPACSTACRVSPARAGRTRRCRSARRHLRPHEVKGLTRAAGGRRGDQSARRAFRTAPRACRRVSSRPAGLVILRQWRCCGCAIWSPASSTAPRGEQGRQHRPGRVRVM